ncbi:type II CRISPR RNA-guided endonuclease Cas9 [Prevotella sp. E13-17]|uniref:type II CRISPR RNA-guided endonuclease Cas9 n=1 Tax=Prevotella sp. E13-17 TaxID=2913616 RepID=UPI001EDB26A9|nr:type II CRISPR RNA-guided endonuclease Cas9 [Prevotella sp. E13-17]UKK51033.1 type II CRISPR RNA-guided endonuclease Cas9 [Prevotella sp. E13-17]
MKKILGLDLGTTSIGWALVNEKEKHDTENSSIIRLGVRVNPLTIDESINFEKGKSITTNANRTLKRGMRRNLQRYKLRRDYLISILKQHGFINDETILSENGNDTTFETYRLRAKAATEEVSLSEFARILLQINKKRGYKSSRKAKTTEEGQLIDGMEIAMQLHNENITPGQLSLRMLQNGKKYLPEYYRSDLTDEFNKVWNKQQLFYSEILTDKLKDELSGKNKSQTWAICEKPFMIVGFKRQTKGLEQKIETYQWRVSALSQKMELEKLAIVLQEINGQISSASGYLGGISDRSKILYFNKQTVGQYLMSELKKNPNFSLKNKVFYRQDYLNEFETIWETQAKFHKELTEELKKTIKDIIIFYQRPLKSQKGLISFCEFESRKVTIDIKGKPKKKTIGLKGCPKSSPLFQEFKIWQKLNDVVISGKVIPVSQHDLFDNVVSFKDGKRPLYQEEKERLFEELSYKEKLSKVDILKILFDKPKEYDMNFKMLDGNTTQAELFKAYQTIIEVTGHGSYDFAKMDTHDVVNIVKDIFFGLGFNTDILTFDSSINGHAIEQQASYRLWHLLYSFEGDDSIMGNELLIKKISEQFGFDKDCATILSDVVFKPDYASLSAKAIRKILPYMKDGNDYSVACEYAGYRHSARSLTKEEIENKALKDKLDLLPRNSLRNPVVEKILNQMINVVNEISATYGKPDEIRIELARELKKSAKEREEMTKSINATTKLHEEYVKTLKGAPFYLSHVSHNDIIRYKLYLELEKNAFKTLYSDTYIAQEKLFSKEFEIEHIVPKAKLFDDSLSNKTLEARQVNLDKRDMTAFDFIESNYGKEYATKYASKIEDLFNSGAISKTKREKLLMKEAEIPSGFINRDLRDSQYIAKKAREILEEYVAVVVPTTGSVTDRLRDDWQLVNIMQELNWKKYNKLGLTEIEIGRDGQRIPRIKDWTKRNDHRHHAMDALTIAFTKQSYIQYLNNLNARVQKSVNQYIDLDKINLATLDKNQRSEVMYAIEKKELLRDRNGRLRFIPPMPIDEFRKEAKRHLESIIVSNKAKNKVATRNTNITKKKNGTKSTIQLTPRGQLHLETIYGMSKSPVIREEKINASFDMNKILSVCKKAYREALTNRIHQFGDNPKKAFTGKNSLEKNPVWINREHTEKVPEKVKTITYEDIYTIRKEITPELKIDKVIDNRIRTILQERLEKYNGDSKKAFSNLEENPIWLNKEKGISIKRVTITGISNAIALHDKRDKDGKLIFDKNGKKQPTSFVNTGNNHHVAIYRKPKADKNGKQLFADDGEPLYELDEKVVSFFEATSRANLGYPIIDKEYKKEDGWQFLFTMKQNEYFVFPRYDDEGNMIFNPLDYDENWYRNPENYAVISPNLYRIQKIATKNYFFRHHLETTVAEPKELKGITYKPQLGLNGITGILKVRVNHVGQIVSIGEY